MTRSTLRRMTWLAFAASCSLVGSQSAAPPDAAAAVEAEWVEIRKIKTVYEQAISGNEIEKLQPYLAGDLRAVVVTGEELKSFGDLKAYNEKIRGLIGEGGSYQVKVNYQRPGTMAGGLAVAHGDTEETVTTAGGKRFDYRTMWTANLRKEDGQWKLWRLQATMDPVSNVFVQETVRFTKLAYGGGGLVFGLILATAVCLFRRKG